MAAASTATVTATSTVTVTFTAATHTTTTSTTGPGTIAAQPALRAAMDTSTAGCSASAGFSACGRYRWWLERCWDLERPTLLFIGLNPSRADAERDDPTLRRLQSFARAWGYGRLEVLNLFARIAASPAVLRRSADPVGPENDRWLSERLEALQAEPHLRAEPRGAAEAAAGSAGAAVAAIWLGWGNGGAWRGRDREVLRLLQRHIPCSPAVSPVAWPAAPPLLVVGLTASGKPRHPLYVPGGAQPRPLLHPGAEFSVGTRP